MKKSSSSGKYEIDPDIDPTEAFIEQCIANTRSFIDGQSIKDSKRWWWNCSASHYQILIQEVAKGLGMKPGDFLSALLCRLRDERLKAK